MIAGAVEIVGFMQNPWFHPGTLTRHILLYRDNQKYHQMLLRNTMSGARLKTAFEDMFPTIWWDNANWRPDWFPGYSGTADLEHIASVIARHRPKIILTFGLIAKNGVINTQRSYGTHLYCHHPNARGKTQHDLNLFAAEVRAHLKAANLNTAKPHESVPTE